MSETAWTVTEVRDALDSRRTTCRDITGDVLARAATVDAELRSFVAIEADSALAAADRFDAGEGLGDGLAGVPYGYKDIFVAEDGTPPSVGSRDVTLPFRTAGAAVLERLDAAGAVPIGRLNLDPFGYSATGMNPDFGDARNPWDTRRIAGGSSGGAAAAVGAGVLPFALGSDTGGSVRIPASHCGVVGLKPTIGRISKRGAAPMCWSQDCLGILTRTVADAARVLATVAGHDPADPASVDTPVPDYAAACADPLLAGVRIGIDRRLFAGWPEPEALALAALAALGELGAVVVDVDLSRLAAYDAAATVLTWAEVGALHGESFAAQPEAYAAATRSRLETALVASGADHANALRLQGRALSEVLDGVFAAVDLIAAPATLRPPAELATLHRLSAQELTGVSLEALQLNRPFNLLGVPAMSLPVGFDSAQLPVGLQLVARPWEEPLLLRAGHAYQQVTDWHARPAPVSRPNVSAT